MVLTRRAGACCALLGVLLGVLLLGGCSDSLFGVTRGGHGDDDPDGGVVAGSCTGTCIGDVAADFDGTARGKTGRWRYLEDHRDRTWAAMASGAMVMTGAADGKNQITTCSAHPDAPACRALPGALLVSSSGGASPADPAIEFTAPASQVIQLNVHVFVPSGPDQTVRIYRNSREDVLFTGTATQGKSLDQAVPLPALQGDRFLVAISPKGSGVTDIGLELFVIAQDTPFPSTCQLALPFTNPSGTATSDACGGTAFANYLFPDTTTTTTLMPGPPPFPEQGDSIEITTGHYLQPTPMRSLDYEDDVTVQFWVKMSAPSSGSNIIMFDDHDPDQGGGIEISLDSLFLKVSVCTDVDTMKFDILSISKQDFDRTAWQFLRVVRTSTSFSVCMNGGSSRTLPIKAAGKKTDNPPYLGRGVSLGDAFFDGWLDDVRVFTGALPCE